MACKISAQFGNSCEQGLPGLFFWYNIRHLFSLTALQLLIFGIGNCKFDAFPENLKHLK